MDKIWLLNYCKEKHTAWVLYEKEYEFNPTIVSTKLKKGENKSVNHRGVHISCFRDKRYIPYVNKEFNNEMRAVESNQKIKPEVLAENNKYMSGIDRQDHILS